MNFETAGLCKEREENKADYELRARYKTEVVCQCNLLVISRDKPYLAPEMFQIDHKLHFCLFML